MIYMSGFTEISIQIYPYCMHPIMHLIYYSSCDHQHKYHNMQFYSLALSFIYWHRYYYMLQHFWIIIRRLNHSSYCSPIVFQSVPIPVMCCSVCYMDHVVYGGGEARSIHRTQHSTNMHKEPKLQINK
jgi:hypothetical protein